MERTKNNKKEKYQLERVSVRLVKDAPILSKERICSPEDAIRVLGNAFYDYDREVLGVVHLTNSGTPINMTIVSIGCLTESLAHPREILKAAYLSNAVSIMLFHNHPSGDVTPSKDDIRLTNRMQQICSLAGIPLLDHVIFGNGNYYSFLEKGVLPIIDIQYSDNLEDIDLRVAENMPSSDD